MFERIFWGSLSKEKRFCHYANRLRQSKRGGCSRVERGWISLVYGRRLGVGGAGFSKQTRGSTLFSCTMNENIRGSNETFPRNFGYIGKEKNRAYVKRLLRLSWFASQGTPAEEGSLGGGSTPTSIIKLFTGNLENLRLSIPLSSWRERKREGNLLPEANKIMEDEKD